MPYITCECGAALWQEAWEAWKTRCFACWRASQDENSPHRIRNLELALDLVEGELSRRADLGLAFQVHLDVMLRALEGLDSLEAKQCRLWFLQLAIPADGRFDPELSLLLDVALTDLEDMV